MASVVEKFWDTNQKRNAAHTAPPAAQLIAPTLMMLNIFSSQCFRRTEALYSRGLAKDCRYLFGSWRQTRGKQL